MNQIIARNIKKLSQEQNIREIYLFGSVARGDQDQYSDIDILIVIDDCTENEYIYYKDSFAQILNVPVSWLSVYRIDKIKKCIIAVRIFYGILKKSEKSFIVEIMSWHFCY